MDSYLEFKRIKGLTKAELEEINDLPIKPCPFCGEKIALRITSWYMNDDGLLAYRTYSRCPVNYCFESKRYEYASISELEENFRNKKLVDAYKELIEKTNKRYVENIEAI